MTGKDFVTGRRVFFPFGILLGVIFGGLHAARGELGSAAFDLALLSSFGAFLAFSPSEWAISQTGDGDERQRALNEEAMQLAYFAVITVAIIGFGFEIWRGEPGPFSLVGAVGGFTHMVALTVLRRRSVSGGGRPEA